VSSSSTTMIPRLTTLSRPYKPPYQEVSIRRSRVGTTEHDSTSPRVPKRGFHTLKYTPPDTYSGLEVRLKVCQALETSVGPSVTANQTHQHIGQCLPTHLDSSCVTRSTHRCCRIAMSAMHQRLLSNSRKVRLLNLFIAVVFPFNIFILSLGPRTFTRLSLHFFSQSALSL
jgi:hypothetical protein